MLTFKPFHTINISNAVRLFGGDWPSACCLTLSSGNFAQFKETRFFESPLSSRLANSRLWRHFRSPLRGGPASSPHATRGWVFQEGILSFNVALMQERALWRRWWCVDKLLPGVMKRRCKTFVLLKELQTPHETGRGGPTPGWSFW